MGQAALAPGEEAEHDAFPVLRIVGIGEAETVAHFVHEGGEEVHLACGGI